MIHLSGDYTPEQLADLLNEHMDKTAAKKCLCCTANMRRSRHNLGRIQVETLQKCLEIISQKNENMLLRKEFKNTVDADEDGNWTKLRFLGLVAKYRDKEGNHPQGAWVITRRGFNFMYGKEQVPSYVITFRNKIVERSPDFISVTDVMGSDFYCDTKENMFWEQVEADDLEHVRVHYKVKAKKRKNPCPNCATGELKTRFIVDEQTSDTSVRGHNEVHCNKCSYKAETQP